MYRQVLNAALKIESNLPSGLLEHCGRCLDGVSVHWPPSSPADAVADVFPTIQRALARRTRLKARCDSVYDGGEIDEVLWHESQSTARLDDGRLIFEAEVDGLRELSSWILGYGEHVEVLAPGELRELVRQRAAAVIRLAEALDSTGDR